MEEERLARRAEIGRERRERTLARLLESAAKVVADCGAEKATIDDFISAAGVARGTFYNHFQTREALLVELWARLGHDPFLEIKEVAESYSDPAERLVVQARLVLKRAATDATWGWLVFAASGDAATVNADLLTFPRPDLNLGRQTGRFDFESIESAGDMVVAAIRAGMKATLLGGADDTYASCLCEMLLRALGVPAEDARALARLPLRTLRAEPHLLVTGS